MGEGLAAGDRGAEIARGLVVAEGEVLARGLLDVHLPEGRELGPPRPILLEPLGDALEEGDRVFDEGGQVLADLRRAWP